MLLKNESRFPLTQRDECKRVWRCYSEQYMSNVVKEGFGQGSMMVWDGISIDGSMNLVVVRDNAVGYIK